MTPGGPGSAAAPYRRLLPLTLAVMALHLGLLQLQPAQVVGQAAAPSYRFISRELQAPAPAAAAPRPATARQAPAKAAEAEPPTPAPTPAAAPAPVAEPAALAAAAPTSGAEPVEPKPLPAPPGPSGLEAGLPNPDAVPPAQAKWRATALPEPARLHYEVQVNTAGISIEGQAQLYWRHDGRQYDARLLVTGTLLPRREQRSTGRIGADGLEPLRFSDSNRRGERATHFVREQGKLVFSNNQPEVVLEAGAQDRLSVVVQLSVIVAGEPHKYPPGTAIAIPTAGTSDLETWVFMVEGEEDLQLPGGALRALKLQRQPRKEFDQKVELWLAPRMDYAPVRLRLTNPNGDSVDQRWSSTDKG